MSTATDLNDTEQADIALTDTTTQTPIADTHISNVAAPAVTSDPIEIRTDEKELP